MRIIRNNIEVCPFGAPLFKCDAWQLGAGAVGALGSLFGGMSGAKAQLKATRETNEANKQIAERNNQWNYRMFNEQNEYNSAVQQRSRLEQAGMNPYLMMNGGSAGTAASAPTADTSGVQQTPQVGDTIANGISKASEQISNEVYNYAMQQADIEKAKADAAKSQQEAAGQGITNQFQSQLLQSMITKNLQDAGVSKETIGAITRANELWDLTKSDKIFAAGLANKQALANIRALNSQENLNNQKVFESQQNIQESISRIGLNESNRQLNELNLKYMPKVFKANIAKIYSEVAKNYADGALSREQAITEGAKRALMASQKYGVDLNNSYWVQGMSLMLDKLSAEADLGHAQANYTNKQNRYYNRYMNWNMINGSVNAGANLLRGVGSLMVPFGF